MRDAITKEIDGVEYTFYQLAPRKSLKLLIRILKIVGAPTGLAVKNTDDTKSLLDSDLDIGKVVSALCDRLDENEVEYIIDGILSQAHCKGHGEVSKQFDIIFGGRLPHLFKVVYAALEVEYGDFFGEKSALRGFLKRADTAQGKQA